MTIIATAQSHVTSDIRVNGREVRAAMEKAAAAGARLVHFPEAALSGYVKQHVQDWADVDWRALREELEETAEEARHLGLWVVVGANHRLRSPHWPHNSLYVISDAGKVSGRYDKRLCSNTELSFWYTPGTDPLVFKVDGVRFGCMTCIEVCFPHLFTEYGRLGVDCILLSSFSQDPIHGVMAQAHAATQCVWLSVSTPVCCSAGLPSMLFGPDGYPIASARPGVPGLLLHRIDREAPAYRVALQHARPWRAKALSGEIYAPRRVQARSEALPEAVLIPPSDAAAPAATR